MARQRKILTNLLETADRLDIPAKWLKEAALAGQVPCLRPGKRKMLFDPDAVERAMARLARENYYGNKEVTTCAV